MAVVVARGEIVRIRRKRNAVARAVCSAGTAPCSII
jgi:hypothetical protein